MPDTIPPAAMFIPEFNEAVCEALGLDPEKVSRVVIVLDVEDPIPRVYTKGPLLLKMGDGFARVLKLGGRAMEFVPVADVDVDDNGNVFIQEKPNGNQSNP